ncbi:galactose oxidase-like domain-containing protein [Streptomyces virginiae]|uniref:galactose oxidase-like domain-containing protein n=1 Tax=Streptomyces virginiae TaxID=1961 RepID=UPI0036474B69
MSRIKNRAARRSADRAADRTARRSARRTAISVLAATAALVAAVPAAAHDGSARPEERAALGAEHAQEHTKVREQLVKLGGYSQLARIDSLNSLTRSQADVNARFHPKAFGQFAEYFQSPDFAAHIAMLPTGKVLLFSFERMETDPTEEPAPTNTLGKANAGRAFLWDPRRGTGADAFKKVTPPELVVPDGTGEKRPAPFFCAGHAFLPNGMVGVFGGNLGYGGGAGAKLSLVFDPWTEDWSVNKDMEVGRWYPSVATAPDGRLLIMSGHTDQGWGTSTSVIERFPAKSHPVPFEKTVIPRDVPTDTLRVDAPFGADSDYPHLFTLRDGKVYGLGRHATRQWAFDPIAETRTDLPARPDGVHRGYGSAVPLPAGLRGPDSVLVLGGDRDDPNTYRLTSGGAWEKQQPRAFGRTQDDTLLLPDASLLTVNGAYGIRDYGNGDYNPKSDLKYRQIETRNALGEWKLGPAQRLPRGYHSNAVVLPDGRVMVTGDELQQLANDPKIDDDMNGSIEIFEPAYLHQGGRPALDRVPDGPLRYAAAFTVGTSTPDKVKKAVLLAPTTATHSLNTSQRHVELGIVKRQGNNLRLQAPPSANDIPPGYYMLFLLDENGVPSAAKWVSFR